MNQATKLLLLFFLLFIVTIGTCRGQACDSVLSGRGTIESEGYPEEYPSFFDCKWTIEARPFDIVDIAFKDFHVELGETCEFDSLKISGMGQTNKFCGDGLSRLPNNGRLRYRGSVVLQLVSDDSVNLRGISLSYQVTPVEPPAETTPSPTSSTPNPTTAPLTTTPAPILTCDDKPCQNGGECTMVDEVEFYCFCEDGFEGDQCEINIDDCASSPCENDGTCIDGVERWTCECIKGYIGETCGINFDECRADPCKNGGTCEDRVNSFHCICARGWTDYDCSREIDECSPNPCQNYGVCEDHLGYHSCICHPKYTGENCTISVEPPSSSPPSNPEEAAVPPEEEIPKEEAENPTMSVAEAVTPFTTLNPDVTTVTAPQTAPPTTQVSHIGNPTDVHREEDDDPFSHEMSPGIQAPDDQPEELTSKDDIAELPVTSEPSGDISHVPQNSSTNDSHQYPNATETPEKFSEGNGTEIPINSTSLPDENTETEDEKSYFPTSLVATITTIATIGGVVGSVLYYCKSAFQPKKVQPSGRGQYPRAQRRGVTPLGRSATSPSSVDSGINSDAACIEIQGQKQSESELLPRRRMLSTTETNRSIETESDRFVYDGTPKGKASIDQPFSNQNKPKTPGNTDEEVKKQSKKKKKKSRKIFSTSTNIFSPRLEPILSPSKLPPLREDVRIIEESRNENKFFPMPISPPRYDNLTPQVSLVSFPKSAATSTHSKSRKRRVVNRSKGKRSKSMAASRDDAAPSRKSLKQSSGQITTTGDYLPQANPTEMYFNSSENDFVYRPQSVGLEPNFTFNHTTPQTAASSHGIDKFGRYFTPLNDNRKQPVFFADLPRKSFTRQTTNYEQNPMRQQTEHLYNISSSFPMHPFSPSEESRREQLHTQVNYPFGHTSRTSSSTILSPSRGRPEWTIEEAFESRNPRSTGISQNRPRTLSPLNFKPGRNDIPSTYRPFSQNQEQ